MCGDYRACQAKSYPIGKSFPLTGSSPSEIISYSKELNHLIISHVIGKSVPFTGSSPSKIISHSKIRCVFYREIISPLAWQNHIPSSGNHIPLHCSVLAKPYSIRKLYSPYLLSSPKFSSHCSLQKNGY